MQRRSQKGGWCRKGAVLWVQLMVVAWPLMVNSGSSQLDAQTCQWGDNASGAPLGKEETCVSAPGAKPFTEEWLGAESHLTTADGDCSDKQEQIEERWEMSTEPVLGQYIVRFTSYKMADEHSAAMLAALGQQASWQCLERNNAASRFPTDFALVEIDLDQVDTLKERLERLSFVKDVHPEQRVKRSLAWEGKEREGRSECEGHSGSMCDVGPDQHISRRPGRLTTKSSYGVHEGGESSSGASAHGRKLLAERGSVVSLFSAEQLWNLGFRGEHVKMGVFDTGIRLDHPHVKNIRERTNWTHEPTLEDGLGHGTFVAGVIGGTDASCPGFAPEVELYTFRVFTNDQVSYTSWFLDAFNYAIGTKMNVVNLSIGGPDYLDQPFVEKVWEITSSGILMVSAIGNDGPLYGTLNNPADQSDVIGVGGIDYADKIASFSSRGMSTWELPRGYGRAKPDVVAYGRDVMGSRIQGGCRSLSGTSVASPVVAGAVCLLASTVPEEKRWHFSGGILNPASMKQALVEGAVPIPGISMYEQGQGKLNLLNSKEILQNYTPRASVVPAALDFRECPFLWPFCKQPLYAHAMPLMFNATVLNGMGLTGKFDGEPFFTPADEGGKLLDVRFEHSDLLWPWSGFLALYIYVRPEGDRYQGVASGEIIFTIESPPMPGEHAPRKSVVKLKVTADIIPTPPREKRLLWDQFHSVRYPPAYLPRDSLDVRNDILDWHGDHPHTNYHDMYDSLRNAGYFLEVLGSPLSCFDATQYGALLIVDSEEEFYEEEIQKLHRDVEQHGLGLVVFAEWYNVDTMVKMRFFDDNTRSWWTPVTGGGNIPALNDLMRVFGIAFGDALLEGQLEIAGEKVYYASGVNIARFPAGGYLHAAALMDKATIGVTRTVGPFGASSTSPHAVLGFADDGSGRVMAYGDSNCLDSSHQRSSCIGLLIKALQFVTEGKKDPELFAQPALLAEELGSAELPLPLRRVDINVTTFSTVLTTPLKCSPNAPLDFELVTMPHRGASAEKRQSSVAKIMEQQQVVTNIVKLTPPDATTSSDPLQGSTSQALPDALGGKPQEEQKVGVQDPQPQAAREMGASESPPVLKRFAGEGDLPHTTSIAGTVAENILAGATADAADSKVEDGVRSSTGADSAATQKEAGSNSDSNASGADSGTAQKIGAETTNGAGADASGAARVEDGGNMAAVEHHISKPGTIEVSDQVDGVLKQQIEASQGVTVEAGRQEDGPADESSAPASDDGSAVVGAEISGTRVDEAARGQRQKQQVEATRRESSFLETDSEGARTQGNAMSVPTDGVDMQRDRVAETWWQRIAGGLSAVPQMLAVVGVILVFVLWHLRRRRKAAQEGVPLTARGNSTSVISGMLDLPSLVPRRRGQGGQAILERSPTLGRD